MNFHIGFPQSYSIGSCPDSKPHIATAEKLFNPEKYLILIRCSMTGSHSSHPLQFFFISTPPYHPLYAPSRAVVLARCTPHSRLSPPSDPCPPPPNPQSPSQPIGKMISSLCVSEIKALHFFTLPLVFNQPSMLSNMLSDIKECGRRSLPQRQRHSTVGGGRRQPRERECRAGPEVASSHSSYASYFSSPLTLPQPPTTSPPPSPPPLPPPCLPRSFLFCLYYPASFLYLFFLLLIFSSSSLTPSHRQDLHDNFFTTNCR